jgi:hypothetical protein
MDQCVTAGEYASKVGSSVGLTTKELNNNGIVARNGGN